MRKRNCIISLFITAIILTIIPSSQGQLIFESSVKERLKNYGIENTDSVVTTFIKLMDRIDYLENYKDNCNVFRENVINYIPIDYLYKVRVKDFNFERNEK